MNEVHAAGTYKTMLCFHAVVVWTPDLWLRGSAEPHLAVVQLVEGGLVGEQLPHLHVQHTALSAAESIRQWRTEKMPAAAATQSCKPEPPISDMNRVAAIQGGPVGEGAAVKK